ncbi:hypothetical protein MAR_030475 [Mya arenaria]|uniref:Endonuclease/exonuclease/phosphatase domain-containing protein n=1 Tax=Mya arenaria TaxID=6604 RepID=A0ABY7F9A5_MYAAR|nr:hypothetical protein MAR_030475 [Mya arenaria]
MFISLNNVDVAVVTEVFPKNLKATNIDCCEYSMKGFTCFKSEIEESSRGVVIYVRNTIPAEYCSVLKHNKFKESVWCVLRLSNGKELLIGGVYKSPSSSSENVRKLNTLLTQASALNYEHLVVLGDFNFPEIDWDSWTVNRNENHPSFSFIECLRDNFLNQHVNFYTRYRDGQDPSCLDLLLSDNLTQIERMKINGKLGLSDHISFTFKLLCPVLRTSERVNRPNFFKGKYEDIRNYLNNVSWVLLDNMNIEESWTYFIKHINICIEKFIPKTVNGKKFQRPKWMDFHCVKKVKKKYHAWRRFIHSHSYRDYQAYCKLRNSATKAIRFSKKKYQKGVAEFSKTNPKAFWSYVKGETKSKTGIGDLVDKDGNQVTENKGKANVLNDFFASKCKVVSFGRKRVDTDYHMTDRDGNIQQLKGEDSEKDLGVLFTESLSFEKHISNTLNKANMIIGLIRRKFTHIDNTLFLTLYKSLVRSHLDYGNLIYFPITKKCKQMIENAQRRATRLIPDLRGLTYNDRLRKLNLPSLDFRRKRFDMIQVFRIVHNIDDIIMTTFFTFADNSGTRGHNLKLFKPKARKSLRQNSFSNRIVSTWNNLPHELVNTTSVNAFKAGLDKLWKNKRFDTSEVY